MEQTQDKIQEQISDNAYPASPDAAESGSTTDLASALKAAYKGLASGNTAALAPLYSDDVYFEDPSHGIQGKAALVERFHQLDSEVDTGTFKFHQTLDTGGEIFLAWTMILKPKGPKSSEVVRVEGASFLKVRNNRIYYHRDYFDLGAFVYENVHMLGSIIRRIKQRLAN